MSAFCFGVNKGSTNKPLVRKIEATSNQLLSSEARFKARSIEFSPFCALKYVVFVYVCVCVSLCVYARTCIHVCKEFTHICTGMCMPVCNSTRMHNLHLPDSSIRLNAPGVCTVMTYQTCRQAGKQAGRQADRQAGIVGFITSQMTLTYHIC